MSDTIPDLWPESFGGAADETLLPNDVLVEQARLLAEKTGHVVEGEVRLPEHAKFIADRLRYAFYLVAPHLAGYAYRLFTIEFELRAAAFGLSGYPVVVTFDEQTTCRDESEFLETLKRIFADKATREVITALQRRSLTTQDLRDEHAAPAID